MEGTIRERVLFNSYHVLVENKYECKVKAPVGQIYNFDGLFTESKIDESSFK